MINAAKGRVSTLTAHPWNLFGTFRETAYVYGLAIETKIDNYFNALMWWAHKDSNLGPAD